MQLGPLDGAFGIQQQRLDEGTLRLMYQKSFKEIQNNFSEMSLINKFWVKVVENCMVVPDIEPSKATP